MRGKTKNDVGTLTKRTRDDDDDEEKKTVRAALNEDSLVRKNKQIWFFVMSLFNDIDMRPNKCAQFYYKFSPFIPQIIRLEYECACNFIKIALKSILFTLNCSLKKFHTFFVLKLCIDESVTRKIACRIYIESKGKLFEKWLQEMQSTELFARLIERLFFTHCALHHEFSNET